MRLMIAASGTAGHIDPAIAIANTVLKNDPSSEVVFVGTSRGMENDIVPRFGYRVLHLESYGFQRSITFRNFKALRSFVTGPAQAKKLIQSFHPDFVLGMGGYFSWPLLKAASDLHIPCALHESNAINGRAVEVLKNRVSRVYHGFPCIEKNYGPNAVYTGNPVLNSNPGIESESGLLRKIQSSGKKLVLIFGGSLGSNSINQAVRECKDEFLGKHPDVLFLHVTGKNKYDASSADENGQYIPRDYLYGIKPFESLATLIVARSGAMTITEITKLRKPAILIPYPHSVNNHQLKNAEFLTKKGAAILIEDQLLTGSLLSEKLACILDSSEKQKQMADEFPVLPDTDSAEIIYQDMTVTIGKAEAQHNI